MTIPKIIHLTLKDKKNIPDLFRENLDVMHHYYKEHDFRIYDDADINDFVSAYDPACYKNVFSRLRLQIMRVDAVRYLWMEAVGGIYFDCDIRLQRHWEPSGGAILVGREWTSPKADDIKVSVHNCVLASTSGHPLWRRLLDGIGKQVTHDGLAHRKWHSVFDVSGPNAISRTITEEHLTERLDDVHILEPSCIYQPGFSTGSPEDALFIHQTAGSWGKAAKLAGNFDVASASNATEHYDLRRESLRLAASLVGLSPQDINTEVSLLELGFDELLTLKLQQTLEERLGIHIQLDDMLRNLSLRELASRATVRASLIENIEVTEPECPGDYPLSEAQRLLFYNQILSPDSSANNLFSASRSRTPLQLAALARALHVLTERHSLLRSVFLNRVEGPRRSVLPAHVIPYKVHRASDWDDKKLEDYLCDAANQPFDLGKSPPVRVEVILRGGRGDIFLIVMHDIIADLWSAALLLEELATIYSALCEGSVTSLSPAVPTSYSAFVARQLVGQSAGKQIESKRAYWMAYLKDSVLSLRSPIHRTPETPFRKGSSHWFRLGKDLSQLLRGRANASRVSLYALLLASFEAMLLRMFGQDRILVGCPVSCRHTTSEARTVGYFENEVVLQARRESGLAFGNFLQTVQADVIGALANRDYPISSLLGDLELKGEPHRIRLNQAGFGFQKTEYMLGKEIAAFALGHAGVRLQQGCLELEAIPVERRAVQCDLALMMTEDTNELFGVFHYDTDMFERSSIERTTQEFESLLAEIVRNPTCSVDGFSLLSDAVEGKP